MVVGDFFDYKSGMVVAFKVIQLLKGEKIEVTFTERKMNGTSPYLAESPQTA
jgi:hypothetical protein